MDSVQNIIEAVINAPIFGALVNAVTIIFGALLGLLFKKGIPERISDTLSKGLALCVLMIGAQGIMKAQTPLSRYFRWCLADFWASLSELTTVCRSSDSGFKAR